MSPRHSLLFCALAFLLVYCSSQPEDTLFERLPASETGLDFTNYVENSPEFNILNYLYFYDGGGVAVGDLNNNGLPDVFLTANDGPNRLFENKGDLRFEDITEQAGITHNENSWSTGVTMADITGNGYLDIYVSHSNYLVKSGPNQLFINNGDMTFTERAAEFGLDFEGYSTQAAFFDYNRNGRLDMFLLNHSFHSEKTYGEAERLRSIPDPMAGDRLFRNDGDRFTDVTEEAGIISSALGYGLGVAITDINKNGWPDIYVGNDFHEDDYLYINNGDGTFTEMVYDYFVHTSRSSMGNDVADLTNDGYVDVYSLDMMAEDYETYMRSGGPDLVPIAQTKRNFGFGAKNARNTIQINRGLSPDGEPVFSEMAFTLGLAKTEWSWAALIADFDNSGFKDIYVSNGMPQRPNDLDFAARLRVIRQQDDPEKVEQDEYRAIGLMPDVIVHDYMFKNHGGLQFENTTQEWGFGRAVVSNGAAYADLNNNGQLELVVNHINDPVSLYRNTTEPDSAGAWLRVELKGEGMNTTGIGAKVVAYESDQIFYQEQMPTRGFQSSVDHRLHFGLGERQQVDSLLVIWPDWRYEVLNGVETRQAIELSQADASGSFDFSRLHRNYDHAWMKLASDEHQLNFRHQENRFNDFNREPLMPYKLSTQGPALAVGDVNGNGLDDIYIGGAFRQPGSLFLQQPDGSFVASQQDLFDSDSIHEDVDAIFFDATGNGSLDLYVVSGGGQFIDTEEALIDRLYINRGDGTFKLSEDRIPLMYLNGAVARAADINGNGHQDLFIGSRSIPWHYGESPGSYILLNDGEGNFSNSTDELYPDLPEIGMVTDAAFTDLTGNGLPELVITGEWFPVTVLSYEDGRMQNTAERLGFRDGGGLWQSVEIADLNGNGTPDIILGNFGTNSRIKATPENPYHLLINEFGDDGRGAAVITQERDGELYPFDRLDELLLEFPFLSERIRSYKDFSQKTFAELFGRDKTRDAHRQSLHFLESGAYLSNGNGGYSWVPFPVEAQAFPLMASLAFQLGDGAVHLLVGGNIHDVKPGTGGKQGAGHGLHISALADGGFQSLQLQESGFYVPGQMRGIRLVRNNGDTPFILATRNNDTPLLFQLNQIELTAGGY